MITASYVLELFDISRETVRQWSAEFAEYLSPSANPGDRLPRQFSDEDMRVFALVASMKEEGKRYADIHAALRNGQRAEPPNKPAAQVELAATTRATTLQQQVTTLLSERAELLATTANQAGKIELLERQLAEAQAEIKVLNREIGRFEAGKGDE
ncbi:MAG: MerR family transcriptional regulator [Chloroflexota bacterium]